MPASPWQAVQTLAFSSIASAAKALELMSKRASGRAVPRAIALVSGNIGRRSLRREKDEALVMPRPRTSKNIEGPPTTSGGPSFRPSCRADDDEQAPQMLKAPGSKV